MKGLMDRCMACEKLIDHLKEEVETAETEWNELKASWEVQVKKLDITRKGLEELENQAEVLKLGKEGEISSLRKQVRQAKEDEKTEFPNSDGFLAKLGGCYAESFNKCLRQVKAFFLDLDNSKVSLDDVAQTPTRSVESDGTDELFEVNPTLDAQGDGKVALQDKQAESIADENCPVEEAKSTDDENVLDEEAPVDQPQLFQISNYVFFFLYGNYVEDNGCIILTIPLTFGGF